MFLSKRFAFHPQAMSMFDPIIIDSEDDEPLSTRLLTINASNIETAIESEDDEPLSTRLLTKRASNVDVRIDLDEGPLAKKSPHEPCFRSRALRLFLEEKKKILENVAVNDEQKKNVQHYTLKFDRGTRRRGVCKYPNSRNPHGFIGLSAKMVDNGTSPEKIVRVIRHELSHACNPGMRHNHVWQAFDRLIGGDGKRCCTDDEIKTSIGHRIEVYCPKHSDHPIRKMQNRPSQKWLCSRVCKKCRSSFCVRKVVTN